MEKAKDNAAAGGMKRQKRSLVVGTLKHYDISYECSLADFLALIERIVAIIPEEKRKDVTVDWTDGNECDSGYIEFSHWRDETDEEMYRRYNGRDAGPQR